MAVDSHDSSNRPNLGNSELQANRVGSLAAGADAAWERADLQQEEMEKVARIFGAALHGGIFLCLRGAMGAGKTTFTRAMAEGLGIIRPNRVCSPTFTLCAEHPGKVRLLHLDLFRLGEQLESPVLANSQRASPTISAGFEALGLEEISTNDCVIAVEWPEFWPGLPASRIEVELAPSNVDRTARDLRLTGYDQVTAKVLRDFAERFALVHDPAAGQRP